jgi:hypothetical protein
MARIRSIKPELRTSITVTAWPMDVRYFFVLLWGYLDDYGRGVDDELLIASDCFPRDRNVTPDVVDGWLELMADAGPICRYEVDGRHYLHCPSWSEHQRPQHPAKPRIPPCPDDEPDDFKEWREKNPQRIRTRSRKSREGLTRISTAFSGASPKGSGGPLEGVVDASEGRVTVLHSVGPNGPVQLVNAAGQSAYGEPREDFLTPYGDPTETLTPEQGAGSREQGSRENNTSVILEADPQAHRDDVEQACTLLADLIEANGSRRPAITKQWRDSARLMLDRDHRTLTEVLGAIRWSQTDDFWRGNVLSMPTLRKQYDRLRLAAQRGRVHAALAPTGTDGRTLSTADRRVADAVALAARLAAEENQQ